LASELQSLNGLIAKFNESKSGQTSESVNYFESLKKIDTSHLKEVGGSISKKTKTIKKGITNRKRTNRKRSKKRKQD
jgi:hypothetical protein